ncbi:MAG: D-alanyl-D-alanine carboxypeptidase family protein, partial [bacterium]
MVKLNKLNNFNFIKFLVVIFCYCFSTCKFSNYSLNLIYASDINNLTAKSAILIEASTGQVIYELNPDESLSPASITKLMTIFLIYESISNNSISWEDVVTVSDYASSMGGSQIFLEAGETQTVRDLTKSIVIASANDSAVAMAEFIGGSEEEFVKLMNQKALDLNMTSSNFENACGLDENTIDHYMSARDIAIISRELITKYPEVYEFTQTWQDSITHTTKSGSTEFGLTNTNKLLKLYDYATGLKTGSTQKALYCLSGTAQKDGLELIAVVMGASTPTARFQEVIELFEYGFSNYEVMQCAKKGDVISKASVYKGDFDFVDAII